MNTKPSKLQRQISAALENDDLDAIVAALKARGSGSAAVGADPGTARTADKRLAAKMLRAHFADRPRELSKWVKKLLNLADYNAHELGLMLLADVYAFHPIYAQRQLLAHADSPNWEVREFAGSVAGRILDEHFDEFYPVLKKWTRHASENARRAVVIAAMAAAKSQHPERGARLLRLVEPLMADPARYVRVNLGPFAVSLALLKNYPELTLKWLNAQSHKPDENVRWNAAMVWSAVGGRQHAEEGARILHRLAADERRFVWRAVASATVKLGRARPDVVKPLVRKWRTDPRRKHAAAIVAYYLK
ncbi:MAG TPA: DNA alkylation repair protein [Anaerolineae bacterium]|nr:DNA alkylation repair protein [Anaerolineae bacterium]